MMKFSPESFPIISAHEVVESDLIAATCVPVYLGNCDGVWIIVHEHYNTDATPLVMTLNEGATSAEALAGTSVVTATWGGWKNTTCQTDDSITALTAAATFSLDDTAADTTLRMFYFPSVLLTDGRDWLHPTFAAGHNDNLVSVLYILDGFRYQQAAPPTAVV